MSLEQTHWLVKRLHNLWRRWSLWGMLVALVGAMLVTLVWLAGRYEASVVQDRIDRDAADAVADIRAALGRNLLTLQSLQTLQAGPPDVQRWESRAVELLRERREIVRIEWRTPALRLHAHVDSPFQTIRWASDVRLEPHSDTALACANARRLGGPAYSSSYFQPHGDGLGSELIEFCLPPLAADRHAGYLVATYSLQGILAEMVGPGLTRRQEVSFTEADGTRLALVGTARRSAYMFSARQLLDLPGSTMLLRMDGWNTAPSLFPNVLTALVTAMSIALVTVLVILVRDNRRRLSAERELGDAFAFR